MTMFCEEAENCPFRGETCTRRTYKAALVYAALGYAVYPTSPYSQSHASSLGQLPRGRGGFKLATTDVTQVHAWAEHWDRPGTNIGVATGRISRLVVIDVDRRPKLVDTADAASGTGPVRFGELVKVDDSAADRVREWARERDVVIPGSVVSATPGGGLHVWLRLPAHWLDFEVKRRIRWLEDVDLLWDNHSFKVPPSERAATSKKAAGSYRFTSGCPCQVPEADDALVRAMWETPAVGYGAASRNGRSGWSGDGGSDDHQPVDVDHALEHGVPCGVQHEEFYRIACSLAGRGKSTREILGVLFKIAAASPLERPDDPWTTEDLVTLAEWAIRFIREQTGHLTDLANGIKT